MKVHVLFAQRKQRYDGEYGLEALAVMTEADVDNNGEYLPNALEENRATGEFESLAIVALEVSEAAIRKVLNPEVTPVPATVVK